MALAASSALALFLLHRGVKSFNRRHPRYELRRIAKRLRRDHPDELCIHGVCEHFDYV